MDVPAGSVKRVLQLAAERASPSLGITPRRLMDALVARERLGSTGMGHGVAIPHARIEGVEEMSALVFRLIHPVDVAAADDKPAGLFFCVFAPSTKEAEHQRLLSRLKRMLEDEFLRKRLRETDSRKELIQLLSYEDVPTGAIA